MINYGIKHKVDLGSDALGNLTRIENELSKLPARLEAAKTKKAETIAQLEIAKEEIKKPFAFEDELKEKTERLNALNIELNLNEKDTFTVVDGERKIKRSILECGNLGVETEAQDIQFNIPELFVE